MNKPIKKQIFPHNRAKSNVPRNKVKANVLNFLLNGKLHASDNPLEKTLYWKILLFWKVIAYRWKVTYYTHFIHPCFLVQAC